MQRRGQKNKEIKYINPLKQCPFITLKDSLILKILTSASNFNILPVNKLFNFYPKLSTLKIMQILLQKCIISIFFLSLSSSLSLYIYIYIYIYNYVYISLFLFMSLYDLGFNIAWDVYWIRLNYFTLNICV